MQKDLRKFKDPISKRLLAEGKAEGRADAIFAILEARGFGVSSAVAERIRGSHELAELDRWVRRAVTVARAEDLFAE